jgi:hypothetical protein
MLAEYSAESRVDSEPESNQASLVERIFSLPWAIYSTFILAVSLYFGWSIRDEYFLSAEFGLGYALGVIGGLMMLALLMYPLRKRFYYSSVFIFSTKNWFKLHMMLGVFGPLLILYHSNFSLGSTNSNVALVSMLLMVFSGLIGRFIYGKTHHGLYGKKVRLKELQGHQILVKEQFNGDRYDGDIFLSENVVKKIRAFDGFIIDRKGVARNLFCAFRLGLTTRVAYREFSWNLKKSQRDNEKFAQLSMFEKRRQLGDVRNHVASYLSTIRKIAELRFYERLFSMWHLLHLPIFFMLIITGFVHVYAVHTY